MSANPIVILSSGKGRQSEAGKVSRTKFVSTVNLLFCTDFVLQVLDLQKLPGMITEDQDRLYPNKADYNTWDAYCLVCAGPSLNPAKIPAYDGQTQMLAEFPQLQVHASQFGWLDKHVGIPQDNVPIKLGLYDSQGDFEMPDNKLFCPYPSYMQAPREPHKQYGLTCHAKCYQLLQDRLGYTLQYQDVWPLLDVANDDNTCLHSEYGGMTEYQEQHTLYKYIEEDHAEWMLLDPTTNEQNAQRIMEVWKPLIVHKNCPRLLSLYCTFNRASKMMTTQDNTGGKHQEKDVLLWAAMAAVPAGVLRSIATKACLAADWQGSAVNSAAGSQQTTEPYMQYVTR